MSFMKNKLYLNNKQPMHKTKECDKCKQTKPPEGGVQMSQAKWHCAACWVARAIKR
jgi:hypothetical protein